MIWHMTSEQLLINFCFLCTITYVSGWFVDRIMGYSGFGVFGNWLILLLGTYVGMYTFNSFGYLFERNLPFTIACVAGISCALLITMAMIKAFVSD